MIRKFIVFSVLICAAACGGTANTATQNSVANANSAIVVAVNPTPTEPLAPKSTEVPIYEDSAAAVAGGKQFFEDDEDEKAVQAFEQAAKLDANNAEAHFQLAVAYATLDRTEDSEKSFNNSIKIYQKQTIKTPKDASAHYNLGRAYNKLNEDQKAQKALQQAVKLESENADYRFELGTVLNKLALYEQAVKELKKTVELDPENTRAQDALEKAKAGEIRVKDAKSQNKKDAAKQTSNKSAPAAKAKSNKNSNAALPAAPTAPIAPAANSNQ